MSIEYYKSHSPSNRDRRLVTSRLTPFEKLPRIGSSHEYIPRPPKTENLKTNPRIRQISKEEPILIAIRLSDGRRLEKEFSPYDRIYDIIKYVKSEQNDLDDQFYLSSGDVPKRQFKHFNLTLSQANLTTHTVLFVDRQ
ncbi:unnamed protein product [Rotaria sp. Silwood1]|nr:unnamed protein product [Rotaria sp. Silwood1]CAF1654250.1 unnamed protein product [Rotaria sp. Silwood1]CAF3862342.1 unnamed protein product [Rotaria sp. Silwood1]CAF3876149.1 unnamed protein product [Rotaria sp. Silwood1]CAF4983327.1 unnamed protein product [Rotaria sp. Silwood1]